MKETQFYSHSTEELGGAGDTQGMGSYRILGRGRRGLYKDTEEKQLRTGGTGFLRTVVTLAKKAGVCQVKVPMTICRHMFVNWMLISRLTNNK